MSHEEHLAQSSGARVGCGVITVSDTRTLDTDVSGAAIRELLVQAGHLVCSHEIVPDDPAAICAAVDRCLGNASCQAVLINGGTGISPRDRTHEAVCARLENRLDGFGELFRMLSYAEIGPGAMLSRAIAGTCRGRVLFCMPGSPAGVRLAMTRLILPELSHAVTEVRKGHEGTLAAKPPGGTIPA